MCCNTVRLHVKVDSTQVTGSQQGHIFLIDTKEYLHGKQ
jgi:hypothetical protein